MPPLPHRNVEYESILSKHVMLLRSLCKQSMKDEWVNSGLTSHQQRGHTETGPRFKVSSERPEKRGIDLATPGLVVQRVIHYTTAAPP